PAFFWQIIQQIDSPPTVPTSFWGKSGWGRPLLGYVIAATLALYTLYYLALLLLAHFLWAVWHFRQSMRRILPLLGVDSMVASLYLPWLLYAGPKLVGYVGAKVRSDNDTPLTFLTYLSRQLIAFTA